jgi:hypothetical protein
MIDRCFNPDCKQKLEYLRDGRVVRVIRDQDEVISVEHFGSVVPVSISTIFEFPADGSVALRKKI